MTKEQKRWFAAACAQFKWAHVPDNEKYIDQHAAECGDIDLLCNRLWREADYAWQDESMEDAAAQASQLGCEKAGIT